MTYKTNHNFKRRFLGLFLGLLSGFNLLSAQTTESVLSDGIWWRIGIERSGVYKIRYEDMLSRNVLSAPVSSSGIALYGGLGGAIPEMNRITDKTDLEELSIVVNDGGDGQFGAGDYILFYGEGPHKWHWNASQQKYVHEMNVYTDKTFFFLTLDAIAGTRKRLENKTAESATPDKVITTYTDHAIHENDLINPFKSSREWYGEQLTRDRDQTTITLNLPGLVRTEAVSISARLATLEPAEIKLSSNGQTETIQHTASKTGYAMAMEMKRDFSWLFNTETPEINIQFTSLSSLKSWVCLDYLDIRYQRSLTYPGQPMRFRSLDFSSDYVEFRISQSNSTLQIWDVSQPLEPLKVSADLDGTSLSFVSKTTDLPEYLLFSPNQVPLISQFDSIPNQNLHGLDSVNYVVIVHPPFTDEAERLADFHRGRGLKVAIIEPQVVFNEFSYGRQDPMAIRRLMRHLRNKALVETPDVLPEYLLLFGAASYDYRNRTSNTTSNKNYVLNYQFPSGLYEDVSFSTDDMFGFLDDGEDGWGGTDRLDIAIGRLPAITNEHATVLVDKILRYGSPNRIYSDGISNFGEWRNVVTNFADDGSKPGEGFVQVYENKLEPDFKAYFKEINIEKIYIDAFTQQATASGARYPDAKDAIKRRVENGTLILNYEGHSNEITLTDEAVWEKSDFNALNNYNNLTILFASSCSFSRYDNPEQISGGEEALLTPNGGVIATVAASRIAFTSPNDEYHKAWSKAALQRVDNRAPTLGEMFYWGKNAIGNIYRIKPFILLGDPALPIALPKYRVVTTHINDKAIEEELDTIKALSDVRINGQIEDFDGQVLSGFNGQVAITIFDKPTATQTLGNRNSVGGGNNPIIHYEVQKNVLFKGYVMVVDGLFECNFKVPKDIAYNFGFGKISYYAYCDTADATGFLDTIVVGGFGPDFGLYADAPEVSLFMNDTNFRSGNITSADPVFLALVTDPFGINHSGSGIGHDIVMILDDDTRNPIVLNNAFQYDPGTTTQGTVRFPLYNLSPGKHNVKFRIWNVFNVSSFTSLDFEVSDNKKLYIDQAYNYPNPLVDHTYFYFTHNGVNQPERVEIDIFDMTGRLITTLKQSVPSNSFAIDPIYWNLKNAQGNQVSQGVYLYRIRLYGKNNNLAVKTEKLIIVN